MSDFILLDGDTAQFLPAFGLATVIVQPGQLVASGAATVGGVKVCVEGDEASVEVAGCTYTAGPYSIPGAGTLKIKQLAGDQVASKTQSGGKPVLLRGGQFDAVFEVQSPAKQPPKGTAPPEPDGTTSYDGKGSFVAANTKFTGV